MAILYEGINPHRLIYTDGRALPVDPQPAFMGYSVGKWDGDVFVVETHGFTDRSWLDGIGHARSDATRITERIRRRDFGHTEVEVTINDPKIVHASVLDPVHADAGAGHRHPRVHLRGERKRPRAPGGSEVAAVSRRHSARRLSYIWEVAMADTTKCAHPACECMVSKGGEYGKYCSEHCKEMKGVTELRCGCRHPGCG